MRRLLMTAMLAVMLATILPGVAQAGVTDGIVKRFWDGGMKTITERVQQQSQAVVNWLGAAERQVLGNDEDVTTIPAVQDVFKGMRVAGLVLLAFCLVISLVELTEAGINGTGFGLVNWFRRFFISVLLTFGGMQFYSIWIRLFNALLQIFRHFLDTHWTTGDASTLYGQVTTLIGVSTVPILLLPFISLVVVTLLVLWFLIHGVRKAEIILAVIIAPLVWPIYMVPSLEDIPKTAFRGFLGLNATLLIVVAMLRLAVRLGVGGSLGSIWDLVPSMALLVMTIFLPMVIKRIVGQGHSGTGALVTAVQLAAGLKFLSAGVAARGATGASAPAAADTPQAPSGPSAYGNAAPHRLQEPTTYYQQARIGRQQLAAGAAAARPLSLEPPLAAEDSVIDIRESTPGSGKFDFTEAVSAFEQGRRAAYYPHRNEGGDQ